MQIFKFDLTCSVNLWILQRGARKNTNFILFNDEYLESDDDYRHIFATNSQDSLHLVN